MGLKGKVSRFAQALMSNTPSFFTGEVNGQTVHYSVWGGGHADPANLTPDQMWKSQPHLRTVVDFYGRHISQLGLHVFQRDGEEVHRLRTGSVAEALDKPNEDDTMVELLEQLVSDYALYSEAFLTVLPNKFGGKDLRVFPKPWVEPKGKGAFGVEEYEVSTPEGEPVKVRADQMIRFKGWTPGDPAKGTSPVETLRLILAEQHSARVYRDQIWRRSGRHGGFFTRPKDAPSWDNAARKRFMDMIRAFTGEKGERAGEDALLEDGIEYSRAGFAAKEEQFVESTKLSLETVCQVYQVNPTMVGMLDNANYSNVKEFRKAMYGDTLGPIIKKIEARLNTFLLPMLGAEPGTFVEFNVEAKLRGTFEEQANVISTAVGGPWQLRNEARKLFNMPPLEGGDELIVPLNLGAPQAAGMSPDELLKRGNFAGMLIRSGFEAEAAMRAAGLDPVEHTGLLPVTLQAPDEEPAAGEAEPVEEDPKSADGVVRKFLARQADAVTARKSAGRDDWWDADRWNRELSSDLKGAGFGEQIAVFLAVKVNEAAHQFHSSGDTDRGQLVRSALEAVSL